MSSNSPIRRADSSVLPSRGAPSTPVGRPVNRRPADPSLQYTSRQRYSTPRRIPNSSCSALTLSPLTRLEYARAHSSAGRLLRHLQLELQVINTAPRQVPLD